MVAIRIDKFAGMSPRYSNRLLPDNGAQDARNCFLQGGELRGLNSPTLVADFTSEDFTVRKVYRIPNTPSDTWLRFSEPGVDIAKGPLVNDAYDRYYWTGSGDYNDEAMYNSLARIANGDDSYRLGVQPPTVAPNVAATAGGTEATRFYVYTYVNEWGEESEPSETSEAVTGDIGEDWTISNIATSPGWTARVPFGNIRLYRTITGDASVDFRLVHEGPAGDFPAGVYVDSIAPEDVALSMALPSTSWNLPPSDLANLTSLPNGILMGTSGRDIYFSEPYRPHAWPAAYVLSVDFDIIGCAPMGTGAAILTSSRPYTVYGVHPNSMVLAKSDDIAPCLSKRSIVSTDQAVFYASNNGLVGVTFSGSSVITNAAITRRQWSNTYFPDQLTSAQLGLNYLAFIDTEGGAYSGWSIGLQEPLQRVTRLDKFTNLTGVDTDAYTGDVYLIKDDKVYEWNPTDTLSLDYTWHSKDVVFPRPLNLGAARIKMIPEDEEAEDPSVDTSVQAYNAARITSPLNTIGLAPNANPYQNWTTGEDYSAYEVPNNHTPVGGSPLRQAVPYISTSTVFDVFADGRQVYSGNIFNERIIRLPSGFKAFVWSFRVVSNTTIYSIEVAETGKELMEV